MKHNKVWNRLRNKRGTTLLECMLALILFSAVMILVATMFSTANVLTMHATTLKNDVNDAVNKAEISDGSTSSDTVTLRFENNGTTVASLELTIFETKSDNGSVSLWKFASPPPETEPEDDTP